MSIYWKEGHQPRDYPFSKKENKMSRPQGIDSITIPAVTDMDSHWFGIEIDKSKFKVVLEDETEENVYLKIVLRKDYLPNPDKPLSEILLGE